MKETSDLSDTFYLICLFISALFCFFLKTGNWNSLGGKWLVTTKNVEFDFWQRLGYFCSLPRPTQHSSCWLLRCVCAVVKWPNVKLAPAFVSCWVLACGEIYLFLTPCSIRELFVAFHFVAGYILLLSSSLFYEC